MFKILKQSSPTTLHMLFVSSIRKYNIRTMTHYREFKQSSFANFDTLIANKRHNSIKIIESFLFLEKKCESGKIYSSKRADRINFDQF